MMKSDSASMAPCSRRYFFGLGLVVAGAALSPLAEAAAMPRRLAFYHTHTGETLAATYWDKGRYVPGALSHIDYILRDFVNNERRLIDRKLLDLLADLHRRTGSRAPFEIISAYRSPSTNAMLRAKSDGVAQNSYHIQAKAIDIRLRDVPLRKLHATAVGHEAWRGRHVHWLQFRPCGHGAGQVLVSRLFPEGVGRSASRRRCW